MKYNLKKAAKKLCIPESSLKTHIATFITKFDDNYDNFYEITTSGDFEQIEFQFHKAKSTFNMISAVNAAKTCAKAVKSAQNKKELPYADYLKSIYEHINMLKSAIK